MLKQEFLDTLKGKLAGLPRQDMEERLAFYGEMIDDRMEEGLTEEEAVAKIGPVDAIVSEIVRETPFLRIVKEKIKPKKRLAAWEITLLAIGAPLWISLAAAAFAVFFSLYVVLWSLIASLWSVMAAVGGAALGGGLTAVPWIVSGNVLPGCAMIGGAMAGAGCTIFLFFGCKEATKGTLWLSKKILFAIKKCFVGKENAS